MAIKIIDDAQNARDSLRPEESVHAVQRQAGRKSSLRESLRESLRPETERLADETAWPFDVPEVEGVAFSWRRYSCAGQTDDYYIAAREREGGWQIMQKEDFPEVFPPGSTGPAIKDGLILMGRRSEIEARSRKEHQERADSVMRTREAQLGLTPPGTMQRVKVPGQPVIHKEVMVPLKVQE